MGEGKRVSWVELYLDLVFVLAVGQLARLIVDDPEGSTVWIALGLFVTLWWTWVGFAVQYNRHGDEPVHRLLFLIASVPTGVAAVAVVPASTGDSTVFALSLAAARVVLAIGASQPRVRRACLLAAALFAVSVAVPAPVRYLLWAAAIAIESGAMLAEDRAAAHRLRRDGDLAALAPEDPDEAVDAHHFAERFGLFLIIMLGEVVVEAGQASIHGEDVTVAGWAALAAAMLLAAALWWVYFDSAADINLKVLELSGGSPTMARAIFAVGHMLPAFSLLITAAGIGLLLEEDPPTSAYWLSCIGVGLYLFGTRAFFMASRRVPGIAKLLILIATFQLGRLEPALSAHAYMWLLAAWVVMCALITTRWSDRDDPEALLAFLGRRGSRRTA